MRISSSSKPVQSAPVPAAPVADAALVSKIDKMSTAAINQRLAKLQHLQMVAMFTPEGAQKVQAEINALQAELAVRAAKPKQPSAMTVPELKAEISRIEQVMMVSRFTAEGLAKITAELNALKTELSSRPQSTNNAAFAARIKNLSTAEVRAERDNLQHLLMVGRFTPEGLRKIQKNIALLDAELRRRSTAA